MADATATIPGAPEYPKRASIMTLMSEGAWDNRSWVIENLEKQGLVEVEAEVHPMSMKLASVEEFMDSTFPTTTTMFPLKPRDKEDQEKHGPLLLPAPEAFLLDKHGSKDSPFGFKMVAITDTAWKPAE